MRYFISILIVCAFLQALAQNDQAISTHQSTKDELNFQDVKKAILKEMNKRKVTKAERDCVEKAQTPVRLRMCKDKRTMK